MNKTLNIFLISIFTVVISFICCELAIATEPDQNITSGIVVFNTSSKKFHNPDCKFAKSCGSNCIKIEYSEAVKRGGEPCKICGGKPSYNSQESTSFQKLINKNKSGHLTNTNLDIATFSIVREGFLTTPDNTVLPLKLIREGNNLLVYIANNEYTASNVDFNANTIEFSVIPENNEDFRLSFSGKLENNSIKGTLNDKNNKTGKWFVEKKPFDRRPSIARKEKVNQLPPEKKTLKEQIFEPPACITVSFYEIPLNTRRLKRRFSGYQCFINSRCKAPVRIITAEITNGISGNQAYKATYYSPTGYRRERDFIRDYNAAVKRETVKFINKFRKGLITQGGEIETKTLVPKNQQPQINLLYKENGKKEIYTNRNY